MAHTILVSGSRDFPDAPLVERTISDLIQPGDTLIHGTARGVDTWAALTAHRKGAIVLNRPAHWTVYGKRAGLIRNEHMLKELLASPNPLVVIFWDGHSRGTHHMIQLCQTRSIPFRLIRPSLSEPA